MLLLNNDDVRAVLTMEMTMECLENSYLQMIKGEAVCRPRFDLRIPTRDPQKTYQWGTMEGGAASAYFAIRMKSDIIYETEYGGTRTQEKYCISPGTFCGLIFLFRVDNGEPLALVNDGYLQHMRVGADSGLGVKYMARGDAEVVGMFGSGGMARSHLEAIRLVRNIKRIQVYSPTKARREAYAREMGAKYEIEAIALDEPEKVYPGADILASCTDASIAVILGEHVEKGTHIISVGGRLDEETFRKIDLWLRLGNATAPIGYPVVTDASITYATPRIEEAVAASGRGRRYIGQDKVIYLKDILENKVKGRRFSQDITYSERGNLQGAQFHAVAGRVYEVAREKGIGRELPVEWFLQDIRD